MAPAELTPHPSHPENGCSDIARNARFVVETDLSQPQNPENTLKHFRPPNNHFRPHKRLNHTAGCGVSGIGAALPTEQQYNIYQHHTRPPSV